jgi:hypothetical protein
MMLAGKSIPLKLNPLFNGIFVLILTISFAGCNPSKSPGDTDISEQENNLAGTWRFISGLGKSDQGEVIFPYGENLLGMLMYDSKGYMSALLMDPDRPLFASGDMMKGTPEELEAAFERFDAYCGTYTLDEENSTVIHHIQSAKFPNWVGTDQIRYFQLTGDTLRITAPPILAHGVEWIFEVALVRL